MSQSLFTSQVPAGEFFDAGPITLSTTVIFAKSGTVSGGRFYSRSTNPGGSYELVLWIPTAEDPPTGLGTGTVIGSALYGSLVGGAWNSISFASPVAVVAGQPYKISMRTSQGAYTATGGFFASAGLTNGDITGPQTDATAPGYGAFHNGSFKPDITGYPNQTFNGACYFVDVFFDPAGGTTVDMAAALTATATMTVGLSREVRPTIAFTATASMTATLTREVTLAANLTATAGMTVGLTKERTLAAGLTATGGMSVAFQRDATVAASLTATSGLTVSLTAESRLSATLTASSGLTVSFTVPTPPTPGPVDPIAMPVALELLACFEEQLSQLESPPALIQLRLGQDAGPLIGPNVDECCAGLAWVRIAGVFPSWDSFPSADNTWLPCGPLAYAVQLEMGVSFCMPWSDSDDSFDNMDPPSAADWATAAATQMAHQTLMRRTAACCFRPTQRRAVGEWTPLPVEGGCTGGKLLVTVSVPAPCSDC